MSSKPVAGEISAEILSQSVLVKARDVTVQELREILQPLGLDITTREALNWDTQYPGYARDITLICELEQRLADLRLCLDQEKKAAE